MEHFAATSSSSSSSSSSLTPSVSSTNNHSTAIGNHLIVSQSQFDFSSNNTNLSMEFPSSSSSSNHLAENNVTTTTTTTTSNGDDGNQHSNVTPIRFRTIAKRSVASPFAIEMMDSKIEIGPVAAGDGYGNRDARFFDNDDDDDEEDEEEEDFQVPNQNLIRNQCRMALFRESQASINDNDGIRFVNPVAARRHPHRHIDHRNHMIIGQNIVVGQSNLGIGGEHQRTTKCDEAASSSDSLQSLYRALENLDFAIGTDRWNVSASQDALVGAAAAAEASEASIRSSRISVENAETTSGQFDLDGPAGLRPSLPSPKEITYYHIIQQLLFDGYGDVAKQLLKKEPFKMATAKPFHANDTLMKMIVYVLHDYEQQQQKLQQQQLIQRRSPLVDSGNLPDPIDPPYSLVYGSSNNNNNNNNFQQSGEAVARPLSESSISCISSLRPSSGTNLLAANSYQMPNSMPDSCDLVANFSLDDARDLEHDLVSDSHHQMAINQNQNNNNNNNNYQNQNEDNNSNNNCEAIASKQIVAPSDIKSDLKIACKFGSIGSAPGQLNMPHGFCIGVDDNIVIADTNNHRISIFDLNGTFLFCFGDKGTGDGQLYLPRKVAMLPPTIIDEADRETAVYVVCDRGAKRSRMQIFSISGDFVRGIPIVYMDIVSGLCTTQDRKIVVVDSVRSGVSVLTEFGLLLYWFTCASEMIEPSDVTVHEQDYYICDFKGHSVNVFNRHGVLIRKIGSQLTKFPNGIDISDMGDVVVGDSHGNRFHVTLFSAAGQLLGDFDCPYLKVSRCCGLKITSKGMLVTLAKNNNHVLVLNTLKVAQN